MSRFWSRYTATILSGQTLSASVSVDGLGHQTVKDLIFFSPGTLPEGVTIEISLLGTDFSTLQSGGVDISLPAGKATQIFGLSLGHFRLKADAGVGADRAFEIGVANSN